MYATHVLGSLFTSNCRSIDADSVARLLDVVHNETSGIQPTINVLYQMLHGIVVNKTEMDLNYTVTNNKVLECCKVESEINVIDILKGAKLVDELYIKNNSGRTKRVVNGGVTLDNKAREMKGAEVSSTAAAVTPSYTTDKRRKQGETGSSAPLLNYIFDTYTNTHQHRNGKVSPGNSIYAAAAPELEALVGSTTHLDCKVDALHDKLVSWVRRKNDEEPMELLTTGTQQYTTDERYSARFIPPDIWRLEIKEVRPSDAAHYDCQLSAHPPRTARLTLHVPEVSVRIVDGAGAEVSEQVCEVGSTVALRCEVRGLRMEGGPSLLWYRREYLLNDDTTRGGISVRTEFGANGANSVLRVARVKGDDAGRYTCTVARAPPPSPPPAHVILHVIKGTTEPILNF
ncbi:hypothetical protein ACJJTC_014390 [Scirpophaga incertulas]